jgi:cell division protein FtsW
VTQIPAALDSEARNAAHANPFSRTDRSRMGVWWWTTDHLLLGALAALIGLGIMLSFAASPAAAARLGLDNPFYFALRHLVFAGAGAGLLMLVSTLSPRGVRRTAFFVYLGSMLLLMALPFIGHEAKGATRWLDLGAITVQPSEFMKPALIVLVSWMFAEGQKGEGVPGVSIAFGLYAAAVALLLLQPDIGQTVLITVAFGAAFWMAGVPMTWVIGLGGAAVAALTSFYFLFDHVNTRVNKFLSPGGADTHQISRASEAIAAGGLVGRGPGEGVMKRHVPDMNTDFIYSVAAEEYGLVLCMILIALFAVVVVRGIYKSMKLHDPFEQVAAASLFVLFGQQALINIAVNLNMIPTKGMTLPFISYGGSSMLAMGLTMGMGLALIRKRPGAYGAIESPARAGAFS